MSSKLPTYKSLKPAGTLSPKENLDRRLKEIASTKNLTAEKIAEISATSKAPRGPQRVFDPARSNGADKYNNRKLAEDGKKKCGTCKKVKSITDFTRHSKTWDGLDSQCRGCKKNYKDKFYSDPENVAKRDIKQAIYIKNNPEKVAESQRNSYMNHRSERMATSRKYALEHPEATAASKKRWYETNSDVQAVRMAARRKRIQKENTKALNEFYRKNKVPKRLWHKEEFGSEKDLQTAIAHVISNKLKLNVELEKHLAKGARVDIYLDAMKLNIEVKFGQHDAVGRRIKKIEEQAARYSKYNETVLVSLNGKPKHWNSDCRWFTPKQLFKFISDKNEN
jgi:hypothetical protein